MFSNKLKMMQQMSDIKYDGKRDTTAESEKEETAITYKISNGIPRLMVSIDEKDPNHTEHLTTLLKIISQDTMIKDLLFHIGNGLKTLGKENDFNFIVNNLESEEKPIISPMEVI
jgi:hypothetical protein